MSKRNKSKNLIFRRATFGLALLTGVCLVTAAGCGGSGSSSDEDDSSSSVSKTDTQVLKNGNFEFFDDNDGVYLISTPDSWSKSTSGTASDAMSGIIGTHKAAWDKLTAEGLEDDLDANDELDSDDDNKIDYNGMTGVDVMYKNSHASEDDEDYRTYIDNPFTHDLKWTYDEESGRTSYVDGNGDAVTLYEDEDGKLYTDEDLTEEKGTNVLMIHNYVEDNYRGTESYYSASTTLTLEAHTAAEISVWVKTSNLFYGNNSGERTAVDQNRGAYIKVSQTVGGISLDNFVIRNINTEQLGITDNNGWAQYTVYVNACDFATTTLTLTLGLGENSVYTAEGYAFFDDVTYTKYKDVDSLLSANEGLDLGETSTIPSCNLLSDENEKNFRTDKVTIESEETKVFDNYSDHFKYYIDLALMDEKTALSASKLTVAAGLTVDEDGFVSSTGTMKTNGFNALSATGNTFLPESFSGGGIDVSKDVIASVTATSNGLDASAFGDYADILSEALANATTLPEAGDSEDVIVMLSAKGAAYTTELTSSSHFTVGAESYKVLSFWIKTSEMNGQSGATVTVEDVDDKDNSSNFTIDSTTVSATSIGNKSDGTYLEDIYDGWVQCFVLVANEDENDSHQFKITLNFGNTTIKGTSASSYYGGWVAVTDINCISITDEDVFGYLGSGSYIASLTFSEDDENTSGYFDSEYAGGYTVQSGIARPSSYNGVNGGSAVVSSEVVSATGEYDKKNANAYAGLINKNYFGDYQTNAQNQTDYWLNKVSNSTSLTWNDFAGATSVQPLVVVNTERTIANESAIYNYGFIGSTLTVSADDFKAVSVKVKVSTGAVANIYLVDPDTNLPLTFETPSYTFWYDSRGNVLFGEEPEKATDQQKKENIAYTYRESDGLYERDGKLYANIYALNYKYYDESADYYDGNGNPVSFENLDSSKPYYADAAKTSYAKHYLVTDGGDRVYSYVAGSGTEDPIYNYFVGNKIDTSYEIHGFDLHLEGLTLRYDNSAYEATPYQFTVTDTQGEWVTVRFIIRTGSESKSYRLELWSGERDQTTSNLTQGSYVLFDYCTEMSLSDEDTYNKQLSYYESKIIEDYLTQVESVPDNNKNIAYFEGLGLESSLYDYVAKYYTYSLYDSSAYIPFNESTADGDETGYAYNYGDYSEALAFLKVTDTENGEMRIYADYTTVDQDISIGSASDVEEDTSDTSVDDGQAKWLLITSIILVVAIFVALIAVFVKDFLKKHKKKNVASKNTYNFKKNKRYIKKYMKANGEITAPAADTDETAQIGNETTESDNGQE